MTKSLTCKNDWKEWKRLCAIDLCEPEIQHSLRAFARLRFQKILNRCTFFNTQLPDDPWHLFETHMTVKQTRHGKCYKDWLFARLENSNDRATDVLQGGASLIMRDVVREYVRKECPKPDTYSLNKPLTASESCLTLLDILSSEINQHDIICLKEYERLANKHADCMITDLSDRERVALKARRKGLALSNPSVLETAGCEKTALHDCYTALARRIAATVQAAYPEDDNSSQMTLSFMILEKITNRSSDEKEPEIPKGEAFKTVGTDYETSKVTFEYSF